MGNIRINYASTSSPWSVQAMVRVAERIIASEPHLFGLAEIGTNRRLSPRLVQDYAARGFLPSPVIVRGKSRFGLTHLVHLLAIRVLLSTQKWSLRVIKAHLTTTTHQDLLNGLLSPVRVQVQTEFVEAGGWLETPVGNPSGNITATVLSTTQSSPGSLPSQNENSSATPNFVADGTPLADRQEFRQTKERTSAKSKAHIELEPWCEVVIDAHRLRLLTWTEVDRLTKTLLETLKEYTPQVRRTRHLEPMGD